MRSIYHRAYSYAFKCNPFLYRDLLHQAYIQNYNKDGTNLFEKDIYFILKCIRNVWFTHIRNSRFQYQYQVYQKQWFDIDDIYLSGGITPDRALISKEFCELLENKIDTYNSGSNSSINPSILKTILTLTSGGYSQVEIAEQMGMSPQRINYYRKKLKEIAMEVKSIV